MAEQSFLAKLGLRLGILGSSASLSIAAPLATGNYDPAAATDASRIGFYFDRTASAEKLAAVVMGVEIMAVSVTGVTIDLGSGAHVAGITANDSLRLANIDGAANRLQSISYGVGSLMLQGWAANGTRAVPTAVTDARGFVVQTAFGYDGAAWSSAAAQYAMEADGLWSVANHGTRYIWDGTPNGSTVAARWMTLRDTSLGLSIIPVTGSGLIQLGTGTTAANGILYGTIATYRSASGMFNIDAGLNLTGAESIDLGTGAHTAGISSTYDLRLANADGVMNNIQGITYATTGIQLQGWAADGTRAAPTAVSNARNITLLTAFGYDGSGWSANAAQYSLSSAEAWGVSAHGTKHLWSGTPTGSTTIGVWMTLINASLGIGMVPVAGDGLLQLAIGTTKANGVAWDTATNLYATASGALKSDATINGLMAADSIKGNNTGGATTSTDLSATQVTAMLDVFSPSGPGHLKGLVPDPGAVAGSTNYLCEDGTWSTPGGGGGGVTSVNGFTGVVVLTAADVGGVEEAPIDSMSYVRNNAAWVLEGSTAVVSVNGFTGVVVLTPADIGAVEEAPIDSQSYVRNNAAWTLLTGGTPFSPILEAYNGVSVAPALSPGRVFSLCADSTGTLPLGQLSIEYANPGQYMQIYHASSGGTYVSPTALPNGQGIARYNFNGYNGSVWSNISASWGVISTQLFSVSVSGTYMFWAVTRTGQNAPQDSMFLEGGASDTTGTLGIGARPTTGNGFLQLASGTTKAAGVAWGTDNFLFRTAASALTTNSAVTIDRGTGSTGIAAGSVMTMSGADGAAVDVQMQCFGITSGNFISGYNAGGTRASQTATPNASILIKLQGAGFGTTATSAKGLFALFSDGLWSGTNNGTYWRMDQTDNASTTNSEALRVQNHILSIGLGAPTTGNGLIQLNTGTTKATGISWSTDTHLYRTAGNNLRSEAFLTIDIGTGNVSPSATALNINGTDGSSSGARISLATWGTTTGPGIVFYNQGGVRGAATGTPDASTLFQLAGRGFTTTLTGSLNSMSLITDGLWDASNAAAYFTWVQCDNGSTTPSEAMRLHNHMLSIGLGAPTTGNGLLQLASGTTQAEGIAWGTDTFLYRSAANALTATGTLHIQGASAASAPAVFIDAAWFTGGSATTTKPAVLIEAAGATSDNWDTAGTGLGVNTASAFTGNIFQAQQDGIAKFTVNGTGAVVLGDGVNIVFGTTTGTKIAPATNEKFSFWNANPVVQPSGAFQAPMTDSTTGTAGAVLQDGGIVYSQSITNDNIATLYSRINAIQDVLTLTGLMKGSA